MKTLAIHTVVLLLSAVLAWTVSTEKKKGADEPEAVLVDGKALSRVTLATPGGTAVVEPRSTDGSLLPAVRLTRLVVDEKAVPREKQPPTETVDGGVADDALPKIERTFTFPGGSTVTRALEGLFPLKARRVLKEVPAERLTAMGLDAPKSTLRMLVDGKEHVFDVGEKTYASTARYLRRQGTSDVLLVENSALSGLEGTETKLSERRLVTTAPEKILAFAIEIDGQARAFVHQERDQSNKRFFAPRETPDEKSDEADAIVSTLRKLRAREYVDERPSEAPILTLTLEREGGTPVAIALWPVVDGSALARVGEWVARITEAQAKDMQDDARAAVR